MQQFELGQSDRWTTNIYSVLLVVGHIGGRIISTSIRPKCTGTVVGTDIPVPSKFSHTAIYLYTLPENSHLMGWHGMVFIEQNIWHLNPIKR